MYKFFGLLKRFVTPYKLNLILNILFNMLAAIFTLFSFAFIIPILQMLFHIDTAHYELMHWGAASLKDVAINNFYYYTQQLIADEGASVALAALAAMLVFMTMLKTGVTYLSAFFVIPMRNGIMRDIRNRMYRKILSLPIGFFTNERKGDVMARLSVDVAEIDNSVMASIDMLFKNPIMIIVCLAMMIAISWQLTLFVFILLPVVGLIMGKVGKSLKRSSLRAQQQWGAILSTAEESISGLRIIKAFNAEKKMDTLYSDQNQQYYRYSNGIQRRNSLAHPMSEFLGTLAIAIVLWFGGSLILSGDSSIDAAAFIYYMVIFYSIINPAKELSKATYSIQKGMASMERIDMILDARNPIQDPSAPANVDKANARHADIIYSDVSFSYSGDNHDVLRDINLVIPAGSTVALVGQSGSGKSTFVDLLPRFWDVCKGSIRIGNVDIRDYRVSDLRGLMGNVNQEAILFNDTIYNNIAFGVDRATPQEVENAAKIANAHEFIEKMPDGYNTNIGDRGCKLSGGQRQRISIARAILKNPPILILDEATSALDTQSERLVQEALERLMKDRTTIVIAHRLSTIKGADLICVMDNGRIAERGTHEQLMTCNGLYRHLVDMQKF